MSVVIKKFFFFDCYLMVWIFVVMVLGIGFGYFVLGIEDFINCFQVGMINIFIVFGLILMMYLFFVKVCYEELFDVFSDRKVFGLLLIQNWIFGLILMFVLVIIFLLDKFEYMVGLIFIGLVCCIVMVIVWNEIVKGLIEYVVGLVVFNLIFQVLFFSIYVWFFVIVLLLLFGLIGMVVDILIGQIVESVFIYFGIFCVVGVLICVIMLCYVLKVWYYEYFVLKIGLIILVVLLFIIVVMFSLKGNLIVIILFDVVCIVILLLIYFVVMFLFLFYMSKKVGVNYKKCIMLLFIVVSNNFELVIVVVIVVYGINFGVVFVVVVGLLVEVLVMIVLVGVLFWFWKCFFSVEKV